MHWSLLLIHSPLLGPSSWSGVMRHAMESGLEVGVPDLTGVANAGPPFWPRLIADAAASTDDLSGRLVVVGHSGAGVFLPQIGDRLGPRLDSLIFVDAVVPAASGSHSTPPELAQLFDEHTVEGMLMPWPEWWSKELIERILPEDRQRSELSADAPRLPRSFYEEAVPQPAGWSERSCAFLRTSAAYGADFDQATSRGWPTAELTGTHLSLFTEPQSVLDAIQALLDELRA